MELMVIGNIGNKIKVAKSNLDSLFSLHPDEDTIKVIRREEENLDDWCHKSEIM